MTAAEIREFVRVRSRPLTIDPPAGVVLDIRPLPVRAVLFDVYGTLLISAAGDIGSASPLAVRVARHHAEARSRGVDWPEVDVRVLWAETGVAAGDVERVAVEHELAVNPVWPMPGFPAVVAELAARMPVGIVSNAQFFTPPALEALAGRTLAELGVDEELCLWSWREGRAKPSPALFAEAARRLAGRGVAPGEVLMVGNSARKDVAPAQAAGFRAALFAGDRRSYDPDPAIRPDAIIARLDQVLDLLLGGPGGRGV